MNEVELRGYILGFLASKGFKLRPEDKVAMKTIFKGAPDWMIDSWFLRRLRDEEGSG